MRLRRGVLIRRLGALVSVLSLLLVGCAQHEPMRGPATREVAGLRSAVNQLTYPPFLRGEPATVGEIAYVVRILAELGDLPGTVPGEDDRGFLLEEARRFGPVTGRWMMLPFASDLPRYVHDVRAVRDRRDARGWYSEAPGAPLASRVETTVRALMLLKVAGALTRSDGEVTGRWLRGLLSASDRHVVAVAAEGLALLGRPVPATAADVAAPPVDAFQTLDQTARSDLLAATDDYVRLRVAAGRPVVVDVARWRKVFDASVRILPAADVYRLIRVLMAGGVGQSELLAAAHRFRADRLPGGLYRDPTAFAGDLRTSLYGLALRRQAGESVVDRDLAAAVAAAREQSAEPPDATSALMSEAIRTLALGAKVDKVASGDCDLRHQLDQDSVAGWQFTSLACRLVGRRVAVPQVRPWSPGNPQGSVAAARLVNALHDVGMAAETPDWVTAAGWDRLLQDPRSLGSIGNVAEVARAAGYLGGAIPRQRIEKVLAAARGCPGTPGLFRANPDDPFSCDLATTLSVRALRGSP